MASIFSAAAIASASLPCWRNLAVSSPYLSRSLRRSFCAAVSGGGLDGSLRRSAAKKHKKHKRAETTGIDLFMMCLSFCGFCVSCGHRLYQVYCGDLSRFWELAPLMIMALVADCQ